MKLLTSKTIGKNRYTFESEGANFHEVVFESQKLSFPDIPKCGKCDSDLLVLGARKAGNDNEYEYTYIKCLKCKAELTFGQKKKGDVFYLRKDDNGAYDWKTYDKEVGKPLNQQKGGNFEQEDDSDNLPF